jgi:hypothetical protein
MNPSSPTGDLLRAWIRLQADGEERGRIAALLGFAADVPQLAPAKTAEARPPEMELPDPARKGPSPADTVPAGDETPFDVSVLTVPLQPRDMMRDALLSGPSLERATTGLAPPLPKQSLFTPVWARALLSALVSTREQMAELDIAVLIDRIVSGEAIRELPRKEARTMRLGVTCWIDGGAGMEPFSSDVAELILALRAVAGETKVFHRRFTVLPPGNEPGTSPVLIVSDFGLIDQPGRQDWATVAEWIATIRAIRESGAGRLLGLIPVPPSRWPPRLRSAIPLISWDRSSSLRSIPRPEVR